MLKKMILYFMIAFALPNMAIAEADIVPIDGRYTFGEIYPILGETQSNEENEIRRYSFDIPAPGVLSVHWVVNLGEMRVIIRDEDEVKQYEKRMYGSESPFDFDIPVTKGQYTIQIIKIAAFGGFGITMGPDNVGDYRFTLTYRQGKSPNVTAVPVSMLSPSVLWTNDDIKNLVISDVQEVTTDGTYVEDEIKALAKNHELPYNDEYKRYYFDVKEKGKVELHFILRPKYLGIEVRDFDDFRIVKERMFESESPYRFSFEVMPGIYTIHLIMDGSNTGEYRFKVSFTPDITSTPTPPMTPAPTVELTATPSLTDTQTISIDLHSETHNPEVPAFSSAENESNMLNKDKNDEWPWYVDMNHVITYIVGGWIAALGIHFFRKMKRR